MDNQNKNKNSKNNKDIKKSKNDFANMMGPPPVGIFAIYERFYEYLC